MSWWPRPITPKQVGIAKSKVLADVIEATNELIVEKWNGECATFTLKELRDRARTRLGWPSGRSFGEGQLDIMPLFRNAGWLVHYAEGDYDNPCASFSFRKAP